ncbi:MAG TPA: colanic acid biosynthesis glycosyltransferase WcaL [Planctomycetes bacterium]|nr:colanic acid biosynthesis glycosyltransferase WcaL [Planctomycetota bacterium]
MANTGPPGGPSDTREEGRCSTPTLAYLASEYPAISHTFIFREVRHLREKGFQVHTASVRKPKNLEKMTPEEKEESARTLYILSRFPWGLLKDNLLLFLSGPGRYLAMAAEAWRAHRLGRRSLVKTLAYLAEAGVLVRWLASKGVDHLHVHFANPAATAAMIGAASGRFTFSLSVHGPSVFFRTVESVLPRKLEKAHFVRCISHFCRSQVMTFLQPSHWEKLEIVRCGVNPEVFEPRKDPGGETKEILCVARVVPVKGQHLLLRACRVLAEKGISFHLTLVGGGDDLESVRDEAARLGLAEKVTLTGPVGQGEIRRYFDAAHVFALPSFAEGVPVVLMEAMSKEIPVIASRVNGIPELIEDGREGFLITPSHEEELADRLERLLADKALREEMGRKGREKVKALYDLDKNCEQMGRIFQKRLARESPKR